MGVDCEFLIWESVGSSKSQSDALPPLCLSPVKINIVIATGKQREDTSYLQIAYKSHIIMDCKMFESSSKIVNCNVIVVIGYYLVKMQVDRIL